jgi:hypothetical protein
MGTVIPRRFRPAIVLCVGEEGRAVGVQLAVLLASEMDAARRACVALVSVEADADGTLTGGWFDPGESSILGHAPWTAYPTTPRPLARAIVEAMRGEEPAERVRPLHGGVLDDYAIARVKDDGYAVPSASVVVWICAAAHAHSLASIAEAVLEARRVERVEGWTLLALTNVSPRDPQAHVEQETRCADQPWDDLLLGTRGTTPLATFAYLFEAHDERDTFWVGSDDVPFAAAEAIFVLTATGIPTTREYDETLRRSLPTMVKSPVERIGSIGTSRLTFPRAQAEHYCAGTLGAAILREWAREERQTASPEERAERGRAAADVIARLRSAVRDDEAYLRGGRASPRLSAEGVTQARGLKRTDPHGPLSLAASGPRDPDGGFMFAHLRRATVEDLVTRRRDLPEVLRMQGRRAETGFAQWQKSIRPPWQRYGAEAERTLIAEVNQLLLRDRAGVSSARAYTEHVHHLLAVEKERLYRQQEQREAAYARFLRATDSACDGPWLEDMPPGAEPANAEADTLPAPATSAAGSATAGATSDPTDPDDPEDTPPPRAVRTREQLLDTLAFRYRWHKHRQPPVAAIAGAAAMTVPPGVLLAQGFLPPSWFAASPLALLLLTVAVALVVALAGWGFLTWRERTLDEAAEDLRRVYRRELSHRCERYEFQQRLALLTGLQYTARRMLERLSAWEHFAEEMAVELERDAERIEQELFEGATGRRDVLVANRQRLRPHGYTLKHFAEDVRLRRETATASDQAGTHDWHKSAAGMLPHLREHLRQGAAVLDTAPGALSDPVREFCLAVVRPYLTGDLVSIGAALDTHTLAENARDLFDTLRDRAVILYRPLDRPRPSITFVAARDEYRLAIAERDQAADAVLLAIDDVEWLATLRLLPGGAVPSFWQRNNAAPRLVVPSVPTWTGETGETRQTGSG